MPEEKWARRSVITGLGATAAALTMGGQPAHAQSPAGFTPARHAEDAWFDEVPGVHRVFIDSASAAGGSDALLYANNLFVANKSGYDLDEPELAIVVCFRHRSTVFAFSNAMWAKYGEPMARAARYEVADGQPAPTTNPHLSRGQRVSPRAIDGLATRGVQYAICDMATHSVARQLATAVAGDADAIYEELRANPVPNGRFVSAGVVGLTRAQEYGYSVLFAG